MSEHEIKAGPVFKETRKSGPFTETVTSAENINIPTRPAAPAKTLDEQLQAWLGEHGATLVFIAIGPAKGVVPIDNFVTADGLKLPAGWSLGITAAEVKNGANRTL